MEKYLAENAIGEYCEKEEKGKTTACTTKLKKISITLSLFLKLMSIKIAENQNSCMS